MDNTLKGLAHSVKTVRDARMALRDAEKTQALFVIAHADELVDRGLVSIRVREGALFQQMEREMGREATLHTFGS